MAEPVQVAAAKPKKGPKVLSHLEVHPKLGGGVMVKHVYEGYQHDPRPYSFNKGEEDRAAAHILRHAGLSGAPNPASETEEGE